MLPMRSMVKQSVAKHWGTSKGSLFCHCTSWVTTNVPLVTVPSAAVTFHVPPPVTALDEPPLEGASNVPEPVKVMLVQPTPGMKQSVAVAVALPPGVSVHGYAPPGPEQGTLAIFHW